MDDGNDGSSSAAHSAQEEDTSNERGTFLSRIIGVLSPNDTPEVVAAPSGSNGGYATSFAVPGMVNLRRMRVEDVMVPKAEIVAVPTEISKDDLVEVFRDSGLSRLPVFDGTLDAPVGLVHLKDVALSHGFNGNSTQYELKNLLRPLLFAPPSMPIGVLLQKMQSDRIHMALVIDEYGGVDGLVTIEDLIEQVIGEIEDEHDLAEGTLWVKEQPGCFLAEARTPLEDFEAEAGVHLRGIDEDDEEVDTLGGLVFLIAGHVPARGEVIAHPAGPEFEIVDADPRRIKRLRVRLKPTSKNA
ncbi:hemolysin family protein [Maritimibacter fusiformis]|uniref:HlyC/CorC family transporter n=1 Tax=Maritimibacter fusiformis TaxID=2603819 RepID=A0A5D0RHR1_9RHOB|nr:hemolysin family protein [Maritimibacter fusiformis]TYB80589.1 HlyC/CorC family transporter [Maritimibacter fusiformis]